MRRLISHNRNIISQQLLAMEVRVLALLLLATASVNAIKVAPGKFSHADKL